MNAAAQADTDIRIGVMQGRLSARPAHALQAFPHKTWREEFGRAAACGFDTIEWIYEAPRADDNPLTRATGRQEIRNMVAASGVQVGSVCADYFMLERLCGVGARQRWQNARALTHLVDWAADIGAKRVLLPLLEVAEPATAQAEAEVLECIATCLPVLEDRGVTLGIEMERPGPRYAEFVCRLRHARVRAYYDTGNSTAQGFDIAEDIRSLLPCLEAVHVKDRTAFGPSCFLGRGDARFADFFRVIVRSGFRGDVVLQHYFEDPEFDALRALNVVRLALGRACRLVAA